MNENDNPLPPTGGKPRFMRHPEDQKPVHRINSQGSEDSFENITISRQREFSPFLHEDLSTRSYRKFSHSLHEDFKDLYSPKLLIPLGEDTQSPEPTVPALLYYLGYLVILVVIIVIFSLAVAYLIE